MSEVHYTCIGTPQGSVMSALLYISDTESNLNTSKTKELILDFRRDASPATLSRTRGEETEMLME